MWTYRTLAAEVLKLIFFWWRVIKVWHLRSDVKEELVAMMLSKVGWKVYMGEIDIMKRI